MWALYNDQEMTDWCSRHKIPTRHQELPHPHRPARQNPGLHRVRALPILPSCFLGSPFPSTSRTSRSSASMADSGPPTLEPTTPRSSRPRWRRCPAGSPTASSRNSSTSSMGSTPPRVRCPCSSPAGTPASCASPFSPPLFLLLQCVAADVWVRLAGSSRLRSRSARASCRPRGIDIRHCGLSPVVIHLRVVE